MGGTLRLESVEGVGTQVEMAVQVPVLEPETINVALEPEAEQQPGALTVLVVDDYPANRMLLVQQMSYLGHSVVEVENGALGLQAYTPGLLMW